mgnify:CR=1 FL=1
MNESEWKFKNYVDAVAYLTTKSQDKKSLPVHFRPSGETIKELIQEAKNLLQFPSVPKVYIELLADIFLDEEDMELFKTPPPIVSEEKSDENGQPTYKKWKLKHSAKPNRVFETIMEENKKITQIGSGIVFLEMNSGRLITPYGSTFDPLWHESPLTPDINPYLLDICAASGMQPGELWRHRPMTEFEYKKYKLWHKNHADGSNRESSNIDICMSIFRNDHKYRKSELVKQLEALAVGEIKRVCEDLRECTIMHFNGEKANKGGTRTAEPELYASFVQIIAQSYLLLESGKNKR